MEIKRKSPRSISLDRLKELYEELQKRMGKKGKRQDKAITLILKEFAEVLINGESISSQFFDFFLEEKILGDIISIIYQERSNETKVQVIQTISILVQNIHDEKSLFFLLSNNHINNIITAPLDFQDEDIVSQYISFMKVLSLSVNENTIHFFTNNTDPSNPFPLFSLCSRFFDHPEGMVRIAVRTITFNCLKVQTPDVEAFMNLPASQKYFRQLVYYVISLIVTLNRLIEESDFHKAAQLVQTVSDELFILHDLMHCKVPCVEECISTTIIRSLLQHVCFPAIQNCLSETPSSATKYDLSFKTALLVIPLILEAIPSGPVSEVVESFFFQDLEIMFPSHSLETPSCQSLSTLQNADTVVVSGSHTVIPLIPISTKEFSPRPSWKVVSSTLHRASSTREIMEKEESSVSVDDMITTPTPCDDAHYSDCLFLSLFFHFDDIPAKLQVLLCLHAMLRTRRHHNNEVKWKPDDSLQTFLNSSSTSILVEIGRILYSSACSVLGVKICTHILPFLSFQSNSSVSSLLLDNITSRIDTLKRLISQQSPSLLLYQIIGTSFFLTLRRYEPYLASQSGVGRRISPLELNEHQITTNVYMTRPGKANINSLRDEDVEGTGIYEISKNICMTEFPQIFGKMIRSQLTSLLVILNRLRSLEENAFCHSFIQQLITLIPRSVVKCGEQVQLNPSMDYISCNVVILPTTKIPSDSTMLQQMKEKLGNRSYNLPAYLFIGSTQFGVVEMVRGVMSVGTVRVLSKFCDLVDVTIEGTNKRCIVVIMQCSSEYDLCSAKSVSSEKEASLIDKTYRYQCRLYLRFLSSQSAHKAYSKLIAKRNLYFEESAHKVELVS